MRLTYVPAGTPGKRPEMLSQLPPSFFVSQTLPSSVPAYRMPGRIGDSASDTIVQNVSAPVTSGVTPPVVRVLTRICIEASVSPGRSALPQLARSPADGLDANSHGDARDGTRDARCDAARGLLAARAASRSAA